MRTARVPESWRNSLLFASEAKLRHALEVPHVPGGQRQVESPTDPREERISKADPGALPAEGRVDLTARSAANASSGNVRRTSNDSMERSRAKKSAPSR